MEKKITIGNVCFIFDKNREKVLLLHRFREPMKNAFTGVGGKTEFHEDIHLSCHREVTEETGLTPQNVQLKGIVKTLVDGGSSSWILFAYTAEAPHERIQDSDEGTLEWTPIQEIGSRNIIGFIREIMPYILDKSSFFEGTIVHDMQGNVISNNMKVYPIFHNH
jgi:8-oxo-dGTP diphosphatase